MRNKGFVFFITAASAGIIMLSGCGVAPPAAPTEAPALTHGIDVRFANCNACHYTDQIKASPFPHFGSQGFEFTNQECTAAGCHPLQVTP